MEDTSVWLLFLNVFEVMGVLGYDLLLCRSVGADLPFVQPPTKKTTRVKKRALHKRKGDENFGGCILKRAISPCSPLRPFLQLMFDWGKE